MIKGSVWAVRPLSETLDEVEAEEISNALKFYGGNRVNAAKALGIDRTTFWRKRMRLCPEAGQ